VINADGKATVSMGQALILAFGLDPTKPKISYTIEEKCPLASQPGFDPLADSQKEEKERCIKKQKIKGWGASATNLFSLFDGNHALEERDLNHYEYQIGVANQITSVFFDFDQFVDNTQAGVFSRFMKDTSRVGGQKVRTRFTAYMNAAPRFPYLGPDFLSGSPIGRRLWSPASAPAPAPAPAPIPSTPIGSPAPPVGSPATMPPITTTTIAPFGSPIPSPTFGSPITSPTGHVRTVTDTVSSSDFEWFVGLIVISPNGNTYRTITKRYKNFAEVWAEVGAAWSSALLIVAIFFVTKSVPVDDRNEDVRVLRLRTPSNRKELAKEMKAMLMETRDAVIDFEEKNT